MPRLRGQVRRDCPKTPGVYGMLDAHGDLIYVGKAKRLRQRLLTYFRPKSRDPKAGKVLRQARSIVWETVPGEFSALLRELELIRRWQPRLNIQGQPRRRRPVYVCLGRPPAPYAYLSSRPRGTTVRCFGPLPSGDFARAAVRVINDAFQLRDCPQPQTLSFADQVELFPREQVPGCLRFDIGTCLAPCAAACTSWDYERQVRQASAFLQGKDNALLAKLEASMKQAARAQTFERAASMRDQLEALRWLNARLERLRDAQAKHSFVYAVEDHHERQLWYAIQRGFVVATLPAPVDAATASEARTRLQEIFGNPGRNAAPVSAERLDELFLVLSWFRKHGAAARTLSPDTALALTSSRAARVLPSLP